MMRLGLIGDPHAAFAPLAEALSLLVRHHVDAIWCTGDIAGYGTQLDAVIELLQKSRVSCIRGNHERWLLNDPHADISSLARHYLGSLPQVEQQCLENQSVYMVHASPPVSDMKGIRLLDQEGQMIASQRQHWMHVLHEFPADVLIVGHTHQVFAETLAGTLVLNPGSTLFNHSCAVLELPNRQVHWFGLSGQPIRVSWNWSDEFTSGQHPSLR